ncbi:hypothetical protein M3Y95_00924500 [Aphelenchoides besseyi]|nr:hypothetical protein M3Y95_00924500 [Aphelenchoides besseyi]
MANWQLICMIYEVSMSSISLVLNALVIYLCTHKLSDSIRSYRNFFIFGAAIDSTYALTTAITQMMLIDEGTKMIFVLESPFLPATSLCARISTAVLVFCSHLMLWSVCVQFVNRLNVFCYRSFYSTRRILCFSTLYLLWSVAHSFFLFYAYDIQDNTTTTLQLSTNPLFQDREVPPYSAGDTQNGFTIFVLIDVLVIMSSNYVIIFYCGYKIHKKLRENRDVLQMETIRTQTRLSQILNFQAFIPLITVVIPISLMCVLPMFSISFTYLYIFKKATVNFMPIANPLIILVMIPRFRKSISLLASRRFSSTIKPIIVSVVPANRRMTNSI